MNMHVNPSKVVAENFEPIFDADFIHRFNAKREVKGANECWPWLASVGGSGYGHMWAVIDGRRTCRDAHWLAFVIHHNRIPEGVVMHTCNCKLCGNPAHLIEGTNQANVIQAVKDGLIIRKLALADVLALIRDRSEKTAVELAGKAGITLRHFNAIMTGQRWGHTTGREFQRCSDIGAADQLNFAF